MATQVPAGADNNNNQSTTDQGPQISGPESETSVSRHVDLNLNILPTPNPTYNPFLLMQQQVGGPQSYPSSGYQISDPTQQHYDQQGYIPGNLYTAAPQEVHYGYQGYHQPVQEQMQEYTELQQQQTYMQPEDYVQSSHTTFETRPMQRMLPRRLPHVRQRIRRRNRTNRGHVSHIHSVAADMAYNTREHSTATSITGSVTSGPIMQTPLEIEGSQERLSRLTSAVTAMEESSGIGENFECNICFQKANEAVVTCCGHLFCWPCLYRWLHVHSYHKECPVCKGAIAEYSITPIYGRENALASARMQGALGSERIPPRPAARRIESVRQQREREEREREREIREAEARERTNPEHVQVTEIEQAATEVEEEGEPRAPGAEVPLIFEATPQIGGDILHEGAETAAASTLQDDVNQLGREAGDPTEHSQSSYLQRRLAFRREQLRQALANSRYSAAAITQNAAGSRGGTTATDRQQMLAATALLSQEWEHIINGSRLVVDPAQAATWLASMHARLANMEGNMEPTTLDAAAQQRRHMIASTVSQLSQLQEDSVNRLAVHPVQVSDWITTMRTRLNNIEQIMQNLERPNHMPPSIINTPDLGNLNNPIQLADTEDLMNPNEFHVELNATAAPQEIASGSERGSERSPELSPDHVVPQTVENQSGLERVVPEGHVVRRSRRRREHGEEASHVVAQEDGIETPHEDQVQVTRKRRRRLD